MSPGYKISRSSKPRPWTATRLVQQDLERIAAGGACLQSPVLDDGGDFGVRHNRDARQTIATDDTRWAGPKCID